MGTADDQLEDDHHSVAVHFLRLVMGYASDCKLVLPPLLAQAGIAKSSLDDPNGRVSHALFNRLCECVGEALHEPCIGLKLGASVRAGHLGSHGFALMSCANVRELIQQHVRYSALSMDVAHASFERRGDEVIRYWRSNLPGERPLGRLQDELNIAITVTLSRWFTNRPDLNPNWVSFRHARPADIREYEALFRCPLRFAAPETAIAIDASFLELPLPHANPQLRRVMDDLCAQLLEQLGDALEPAWLSVARRSALQSFQQGEPKIGAIAKSAGFDEAQLKDRLAQRGLSFRSFIDDLRHKLAIGYARDPSLGLVDIAYLLGFSEQSAFQRAFKRWTGMTPGEYRQGSFSTARSVLRN